MRLQVVASHTFRCRPEIDNVQSVVDWLTRYYFATKYEYLGTYNCKTLRRALEALTLSELSPSCR